MELQGKSKIIHMPLQIPRICGPITSKQGAPNDQHVLNLRGNGSAGGRRQRKGISDISPETVTRIDSTWRGTDDMRGAGGCYLQVVSTAEVKRGKCGLACCIVTVYYIILAIMTSNFCIFNKARSNLQKSREVQIQT